MRELRILEFISWLVVIASIMWWRKSEATFKYTLYRGIKIPINKESVLNGNYAGIDETGELN